MQLHIASTFWTEPFLSISILHMAGLELFTSHYPLHMNGPLYRKPHFWLFKSSKTMAQPKT